MKKIIRSLGIAGIVTMAVTLSAGAYDNSPTDWQVLPEVIWAPASGGGTWATEVQIIDMTGGSQVYVSFYYGGGLARGAFLLWTGGGMYSSGKFNNILKNVQDWYDPGFSYYGKVGAMWFLTQDASHKIQVTARTVNGNYSKTFPGLNGYDSNTAALSRAMMITNLAQHAQYRSTVGFHNPTTNSVTVGFVLIGTTSGQIGSVFYKTFAGKDFQAFYPFAEAGVGSGVYDNVWLGVVPTSGSGKVYCFGATANNYTNDPAAHLALQLQ